MTTYNTGNPIGSTDPRDLYDNAENLDAAVNDTNRDTWSDRLGRSRKTMSGMERQFDAAEDYREATFVSTQIDKQDRFNSFIASSGYQFVGDYAAGIEITEYNQIVRDENGEFWRVSGQIDLPYTSTGTGLPEGDAFVPAGDAVLRQNLANPNMGAALVAYSESNVHDALDELQKFRGFKDLPTLLGDTSLEYGGGASQVAAGDIIHTRSEGFSYQVAALGVSDNHITTAGGVKLYATPREGAVYPEQFGSPSASSVQAAASAADSLGVSLKLTGGETYNFDDTDVEVAVPVNGGFPRPTVRGRFRAMSGGGEFSHIYFEKDPAWGTKLDHRAIYCGEDNVAVEVRGCVFDGCSAFMTEPNTGHMTASETYYGNEWIGVPNHTTVNAIEARCRGALRVECNKYRGIYHRFVKASTTTVGTPPVPFENNTDTTLIINNEIMSGTADGKQIIDLYAAGGRKTIVSGNIGEWDTRVEAFFNYKHEGLDTPDLQVGWHDSVVCSMNALEGRFDCVVFLVGAYGTAYESVIEKAIIGSNIFKVLNSDFNGVIRTTHIHKVNIHENIIETPAPDRSAIHVTNPHTVSITGNSGDGRILVDSQSAIARPHPMPCAMVSIRGNSMRLDTSTVHGITVTNMTPDAAGSVVSITDNPIQFLGGTRDVVRINNVPFDTGIINGNSSSNNAWGLSFNGTVPTRLDEVGNSWQVKRTLNTADANFTITRNYGEVARLGATLTANRTITLSTTNRWVGDRHHIIRTGGGASFTWDVGGIVNLGPSTWCEVIFNGSAWEIVGYGKNGP